MKELLKQYAAKYLVRNGVLIVSVAAVLTAGYIGYKLFTQEPHIITRVDEKTVTVEVPKETLVTRDVIKYVEDKENVRKLMEENKRLKLQVQQLSETIAKHESSGKGVVAQVPPSTVPEPLRPATQPSTPSVTEFKDWRLHFVTDGKEANYTLSQKFEVISTTGRGKDGKPISLVQMFEIGPGDTRTVLENVQSVSVFATPDRPEWHVGLTVQAGVGLLASPDDLKAKKPAAIVGVQWLKRGTTEAAEDSSLSLLSIVAALDGDTAEFGVLPVSVNLGRIPKQPFKDLWLSPYVGYDLQTKRIGRIGFAATASF